MAFDYQKKVNENLNTPIRDQKILKEYRNDQAVDKLRNNKFNKEEESENTENILEDDIENENYDWYLQI